jgi:hypothetical protein
MCLLTIKYKELIGLSEQNSESLCYIVLSLSLSLSPVGYYYYCYYYYYYILEKNFADVQIRSVVNLSGVKSKIRLFASIVGSYLAVKLCTWYVGIFMSDLPNHFQMHNSNCSFVITVQHDLHCHCIIILNSKRETLLITYLLYLLHGAESFLRSSLVCS